MYDLRKAAPVDLPLIYKMQNVPVREKLLATPLPREDDYIANAVFQMNAGNEHFYLLEDESVAVGLVWICTSRETCEIWGKHLHSLFYACARIAFEELNMQRLVWWVRESNPRMLQVCKRFRIPRTGSESICSIGEKLEFLAIGEIHYFEFKASEYPERITLMQQYSLRGGNFFRALPIQE
jgi:hypothetical protein